MEKQIILPPPNVWVMFKRVDGRQSIIAKARGWHSFSGQSAISITTDYGPEQLSEMWVGAANGKFGSGVALDFCVPIITVPSLWGLAPLTIAEWLDSLVDIFNTTGRVGMFYPSKEIEVEINTALIALGAELHT